MRLVLEFPLLRRELIGLLRTRRAFWLTVLVVGLSALLPLIGWPEAGQVAYYSMQNRVIFTFFAITQLSATLLIIPAFTAGAISGERERNTYELLYTTLLSPFSIVFSKLLASVGYILILLLASAPSVCVLFLLGGIGFDMVVKTYLVTFVAVVTSGIVCLTVSMRSRRTAHAVVRGLTWVVFWNGGVFLLAFLVGVLAIEVLDLPLQRVADEEYVLALTPFAVIPLAIWSDGPGGSPARMLDLYLVYAGIILVFHLVYLLRKVRVPELAVARWRERRRARSASGGPPPGVRRSLLTRFVLRFADVPHFFLANPVFLKEIRSEFFGKVWYRRFAFWVPLLLFIAIILIFENVHEDEASPITIAEIALALVVLRAPAVMASSIPREIEQGNMDFLRGTLLPLPSVLNGKLWAGFYSVLGILAAAAWSILLAYPFIDGGDVHLGRALVTMLVVLPLTVFFTLSVAAFFSALSRRTLGALLGTYLTLIFIFLLLPILLLIGAARASGPGSEIFFSSISPFVTLVVGSVRGPLDGTGEHLGALLLFALWYAAGAFAFWLLARFLVVERHARDR